MNVDTFLDSVQAQPWYENQIAHCEWLPPRAATFGGLKRPLPAPLQAALEGMGIERLYSHQAQAVNAARNGRDVVVATSTASGKTLCYNLPVLETILEDYRNRALYLFPTKALAQDQLRALGKLTAAGGPLAKVRFGTYDGDTPQAQRTGLRHTGHIILTNPDMLHLGILPNHPLWSRMLERQPSASLRDVRSLGHRRCFDRAPPRHRHAPDLHLRRIPWRRRDRRARLRAGRGTLGRHAPGPPRLLL